jgi:tetratricopeptide (TPR) repeat protein
MEAYPAIRLFIQCARRANAECSICVDELPHVVHLCQLLDGMPLGLELAASWVRSMTIQEITAEVANDLDFLSTTLTNVPAKHRSLRTVFEQTWQRLSADEQTVLAKLSIFHGGFRRAAAEIVAGATRLILSTLVEKALLRRSHAGRYDMHEIVRQFASENLRRHITSYQRTLNQHSAYYAAFLQQLEDDTVGWNMLKTFNTIGAEIDNIFAALDWAVTQKDAVVFEQTAECLIQYWPYPALERQGLAIIERALAALTASTERKSDLHDPKISPKLRPIVGFLMAIQGFLITRMGSPPAAQVLLQQGITLQDSSTPRHQRQLAKSKYYLGWNLYFQGKYQEALSQFHEALTLFSDIQYPHGLSWTLFQLGRISYQRGRYAEAENFFVKSRQLSDKFGFFEIGGYSLCHQAAIAIEQGRYNKAMNLLNRSMVLHRDAGAYMDLAVPSRERGRLYLLLGRFARAKVDLDHSMALYRKHGSAWLNEVNLNIAGHLNRLQGNYEQANQLYNRSLAAAQEVNNQKLTAYYLNGLATVAYDQDQYAKAEKLLLQALHTVKKLHNEPEIASTLRYLGHARLALGKDGCQQYYRDSLQLAETHRLAPLALDILVGIAQLLAQSGQKLKAIELLTMVTGHESSTHETKTNAIKVLKVITADIDDKLLAVAQSRGREQELWEITDKLINDGL